MRHALGAHPSRSDVIVTENPIGMILFVAMMLEWSFGQTTEARTIERAVTRALNGGAATRDLGGTHSTTQVADAVIAAFAVA